MRSISIHAIIPLVISIIVGAMIVSPVENKVVTDVVDSLKNLSPDEQTKNTMDEVYNYYNLASFIDGLIPILKLLFLLAPFIAGFLKIVDI